MKQPVPASDPCRATGIASTACPAVIAFADAAPKGDFAVGLLVVFVGLLVGTAIGLGFALRRLHRRSPAPWRWPVIVLLWILLLGCLNAVATIVYEVVGR